MRRGLNAWSAAQFGDVMEPDAPAVSQQDGPAPMVCWSSCETRPCGLGIQEPNASAWR